MAASSRRTLYVYTNDLIPYAWLPEDPFMLRVLLKLVTVVALLVPFLIGCSRRESPQASPSTSAAASPAAVTAKAVAPKGHQVGEAVQLGDLTWTVVTATDRGQVLADTKKTSGRFVMLQLRVMNVGSKAATVRAPRLVDWEHDDRLNPLYDGAGWVPDRTAYLSEYELAAGKQKDFWVIYDVQATGKVLQLQLAGAGTISYVDIHAQPGTVAPVASVPAKADTACSEKCQDNWANCSAVNLGNDVGLEVCNKRRLDCHDACGR